MDFSAPVRKIRETKQHVYLCLNRGDGGTYFDRKIIEAEGFLLPTTNSDNYVLRLCKRSLSEEQLEALAGALQTGAVAADGPSRGQVAFAFCVLFAIMAYGIYKQHLIWVL